MTRSRTAKLQKAGGQQIPTISLDDIKSVKLKSVGDKRGVKVRPAYTVHTMFIHSMFIMCYCTMTKLYCCNLYQLWCTKYYSVANFHSLLNVSTHLSECLLF